MSGSVCAVCGGEANINYAGQMLCPIHAAARPSYQPEPVPPPVHVVLEEDELHFAIPRLPSQQDDLVETPWGPTPRGLMPDASEAIRRGDVPRVGEIGSDYDPGLPPIVTPQTYAGMPDEERPRELERVASELLDSTARLFGVDWPNYRWARAFYDATRERALAMTRRLRQGLSGKWGSRPRGRPPGTGRWTPAQFADLCRQARAMSRSNSEPTDAEMAHKLARITGERVPTSTYREYRIGAQGTENNR